MATKSNLGKMVRVPLREAWVHEAADFTPWLARPENLDELADALGLSELELVATEHWIGSFKLDVLCTDGDDQVIIENQLAETDHKHLGQLLAYAAGVEARKVIWIADSFRPEHEAALRYLNDNSSDDLAFFGVQVELWRIGDSPLAPKFKVVVKPDNWSRSSRQQVHAAAQSTPTKLLQMKFWTALVGELGQKAPRIRPHRPRPQHWLSHSIGRSGFNLNVTANTRGERLGVELWIQRDDAKDQFAHLLEQRGKIESALGFELDWQELPDARACRIVSYLEDASIEDEGRWPELLDWLVPRIVAFDRVFRPLMKTLP